MNNICTPTGFSVIELRRYTIKQGARAQFGRYFETYFPEAFQQLGAIAFGHFFERARPERFTWLRGYRDMPERAAVNQAFYDGPVWKEHKAAVNGLIVDSDDVLLLRPLHPHSGVAALPAVDPVAEPEGAQGLVVAHVFRLAPGALALCEQDAEPWFAGYRARGLVEAGILTTLDAPNNFPRHPIRTDGHYLVWLGVLRDEVTLAQLRPAFARTEQTLAADGLLDGPAELIVLDPGHRSRLRWLRYIDANLGSAA